MDYLVIAAHPDDAELGVGGTIAALKAQGATGRHSRSDQRRTHALRYARDPSARDRGGQCHPQGRLARQPGIAESLFSCRSGGPAAAGRDDSSAQTSVFARTLLGRRPSRPCGGQRPGRCRPFLEQAHQNRHAWRAVVSGPHLVLFQRTSAAAHQAFVCRRRFGSSRNENAGRRLLSLSVHSGPADRAPTFLDNLRDWARYWGWTIGTAFGEPILCREEVGIRSLRDLV